MLSDLGVRLTLVVLTILDHKSLYQYSSLPSRATLERMITRFKQHELFGVKNIEVCQALIQILSQNYNFTIYTHLEPFNVSAYDTALDSVPLTLVSAA